MFRSNSPFGNSSSSYADSIRSSRYSVTDDESSVISSLSRPSAMSIYLQRKDYATSINKVMDTCQYRVEHLFSCELNGMELRTLADCVKRLKLLEEEGRVWGQSMLLEIRGPTLLLTDIETKMELESMPLSDIVEVKTVLDAGAFTSLLTISIQNWKKNTITVFMFKCEDAKTDTVQRDLSRVLSARIDPPIVRNAALQKSLLMTPYPGDNDFSELEGYGPEEEEGGAPLRPLTSEELSRTEPYTDLDKRLDIFNHIVGDIEIFVGQITAAQAKTAKKKKKKKKEAVNMPTVAEFVSCLRKFKCAFNLLMELDGQIEDPSATEFVHLLFTTLSFVVSHSPMGLPQTVVTPLLTPQFVNLMSREATEEENKLWQSLGDAWNIPSLLMMKIMSMYDFNNINSNEWPGDKKVISTYTLEFSDGWQPPKVSAANDPVGPVSRQTSVMLRPAPNGLRSEMSKQQMLVLYDFTSRNSKELTVKKGDIVELLDKTKQWWMVRDSRGVEGYVPNNVLKPHEEEPVLKIGGSVRLTKKSQPAEVKAWLEEKRFREITVRCLAGLNGASLLNMTREELKTVCPEEGGRVFFQLQAVRSTLAADS